MLDTPIVIEYAQSIQLARYANVLQGWMPISTAGCGLAALTLSHVQQTYLRLIIEL